jgi:hypothetical protein
MSQPFFWILTLVGNGLLFIGSWAFHRAESGSNPQIGSFLDSFLVGAGLMTTIGFGSVNPMTPAGKILCVFMMMMGTLFIWFYMAFFVSALISKDLTSLEAEIEELESGLTEIHKDTELDHHTVARLTQSIDQLRIEIARMNAK